MTSDHQLRPVATDATGDDRLARNLRRRPHINVWSAVGLATVLGVLSVLVVGHIATGATTTTRASAQISTQDGAKTQHGANSTPTDGKGWRDLGRSYTRRAHETADPSYYPLARNAFAQATKLLPASAGLFADEANLALALHDFGRAHRLATQALTLEPTNFAARIALFDATVELGRYEEAATQVIVLTDQHPGVASLSRLSYIRQLNGDIVGAEIAMRSAVASAPEGSFDRAVTLAYLGEVLLEGGQRDAAVRAFVGAQKITPNLPLAVLGLAHVRAGDGDYTAATTSLQALTDRVPLPAAFGLQADMARAQRSADKQRDANELVDASIALFRSNGAVVDAELAIILADRGPASADDALVAARRAYAERQTIFTADAMAWALFQNGATEEAATYARRAIATTPAVASVRWHAAKILAAVGDTEPAHKELAAASINRWFSPSQKEAQADLTSLLTTPSKVTP